MAIESLDKLNRLAESHGELRVGRGLIAFLDHLFGTAVKAERVWPDRYGVKGDYMPAGFVRQQSFPFTWDGKQGAEQQRS